MELLQLLFSQMNDRKKLFSRLIKYVLKMFQKYFLCLTKVLTICVHINYLAQILSYLFELNLTT